VRKNKDLEDSVKIQGTKLNFRAFSIGCAALLALACGSENSGGDDPVDEPVDDGDVVNVQPPAPQTCEENPLLAICQPPDDGGDDVVVDGDDQGDDDGAAVEPDEGSELDIARAAAENILRANCGQCHGPALTPEQARAGMNYIDDIDELVTQGKIVPLDSDASLIVRRMRNGEMPPANSTGPRPSDQDIQTVANFIDNPNFWDAPAAPADCIGQEITYDEIYDLIQGDLLRQDADDRPFTRYLSLTNRYNAGVCVDAMDQDRWSMNKMVNMLSINAQIEEPVAINSDQTIYRLDIRDYDWDRAVEVDGENFDDLWEAFIAIDPYAVPFVGDEADVVRLESETDLTILNVDQLLDTAIIGNLYYAAIDVDVDQTLDEFVLDQLGIDEEDNLDQDELIRAGTTASILSRQDTLVQRQDIEVRFGAFWERFDFDANEDNESIFEDVFDFQEGGSQAIFSLPNGLLGYIIADEDRNIVEESDILFDTLQNDFVVRTAVSCSGCHAQGFLPVVDQVRDFVERNRRDFDADDYEAVQEVYPSAAEFSAQVEDDSEVYRGALSRAGVPTDVSDPVSDVFLRFDRDVTLEVAAGDLGVRPDDLERELNILDPALGVLESFTIDRDDFTELYTASLCVMQSFSQNQPDLDLCDDAIAALDD
jgi:mono/diheme cytochrome c family protein